MRTKASVADVVSCISRKCNRWNKEKVKAKFGKKKYITLQDLFSCRSVRWYDKVWVISTAFFGEAFPFNLYPYLEEYTGSLSPSSDLFRPITSKQRRELLQRIKAQAREAGLLK